MLRGLEGGEEDVGDPEGGVDPEVVVVSGEEGVRQGEEVSTGEEEDLEGAVVVDVVASDMLVFSVTIVLLIFQKLFFLPVSE